MTTEPQGEARTEPNGTTFHHVSLHEPVAWARSMFELAVAAGTTADYFPHHSGRDLDATGVLDDRDIRTVASLVRPPSAIARALHRQAVKALGDLAGDRRIRFLPPELLHLTHDYVPAGRTKSQDQQRIDAAARWSEAFRDLVQSFEPVTLTVEGLTMTKRQLLATYKGDVHWNRFVASIAQLEAQIPDFHAPYDITRSPLQPGSKVLQTTLAVFADGIDTRALARCIAPFLPGGRSTFEPQSFMVAGMELVTHAHDEEYVLRVDEVLAAAPLGRVPNDSFTSSAHNGPTLERSSLQLGGWAQSDNSGVTTR